MTGDRLDQDLPDDEEFVVDFGDEEAELFGDVGDESAPETDPVELEAELLAAESAGEFEYELSESVEPTDAIEIEDPVSFGGADEQDELFELDDTSEPFEVVDAADDATPENSEADPALELFSEDAGSPEQAGDDSFLDFSENDSFVLVDKTPEANEDGDVNLDPDDLLFDDHREELAAESDFGADLGPKFDRDNSFEMPDIELSTVDPEDESTPMAVEGMTEEVDVDFSFEDQDSFLDAEENDDWGAAEPLTEQPTEEAPAELGLTEPEVAETDFADLAFGEPEPEEADASEFGMQESTRDIDFAAEEPAETEAAADLWGEDDATIDSSEEFDPIYGDAAAQTQGVEGDGQEPAYETAASYEEADYSEYEEAYADGTAPNPIGEVVGSVAPRSRWRMVAGLAAVLPIAAAGVIAFAKPEWFRGITGETPQQVVMVDRIEIDRPNVDLDVDAPVVAFAETEDPTTTPDDPEVRTGDPDPVAITGEPGTEVEVTPDGVPVPVPIDPPPVTPDPGTETEVVTQVETPEDTTEPVTPPVAVADDDPEPAKPDEPETPPAPEFIQAGDNLLIGRVDDLGGPELPAIARDLRPGTQAFARLTNGSFFMGQVRRVNAAMITLKLESGEISLRYDELMSLSPLANADLSDVTATQRGFVRLHNQQRLFGAILRDPSNGRITLSDKSGSVTVPDWQISTVGFEAGNGVEIVNDGDDDWLRQRARRRLTRRD